VIDEDGGRAWSVFEGVRTYQQAKSSEYEKDAT
jgi:hypothetical protein